MREIADAAGMPLILYLKSEDGFGADREAGLDAVGRLMRRRRGDRDQVRSGARRPAAGRVSRRPAAPRRSRPRDQRHGRAAGGRAPARLRAWRASRPAPAASRRRSAAALFDGVPGARTGRAAEELRAALHAARGSARRVGPGARAAPRDRARRHRADRSDPAVRLAARRRRSSSSSRRSRARLRERARMSRPRLTPADLRSHRWFGKDDLRSFGHRSRAKQAGFSLDDISRQAGHRHPQHLERRQPLPHPLPPPRRGSQARRLAGRRVPDGDPGADARRDVHEAEHDALPQPAGDGGGGSAALVSGRRRRPARRLRQDGARRW